MQERKVNLNNIPKKVGYEINKRVGELNLIKNNPQLLEFLRGVDRSNFDAEANEYLDGMIKHFEEKPNFVKNFQQVYNVLLAGQGLRVI